MENKKTIILAEIGINHNGDLNTAKQLIKSAKLSGAGVVKFQKRNPDVCVPEHQKNVIKETPWGKMTYYEYKKQIEFEKFEYDEIDKFCKKLNIQWTASVWDIDSLHFIMHYDVPFIKIASACITDLELLKAINKYKIPATLSIGMSTEKEIKTALNTLDDCPITLLHCNSSYPVAENELDLNVITTLKEKYGDKYVIGYSGHELGMDACIIAKALGAEVIERHITLDKNMWGSDHKASLEPHELKELVDKLNKVDIMLGSNDIKVYPSEEKIKTKLRRI